MVKPVCPVDVITLCGADGELRPLRIRLTEESGERIRGDVREIISTSESIWVGAESKSFLCRVHLDNRNVVLELKYSLRSHSWSLMRRLY